MENNQQQINELKKMLARYKADLKNSEHKLSLIPKTFENIPSVYELASYIEGIKILIEDFRTEIRQLRADTL